VIEPGVRIIGEVVLGQNPSICAPSELMAKDSSIIIGDGFDCAAFVTISTADSHLRCLGLSPVIERKAIIIEDHVFIGTGAVILGGCRIGHHSVIGAGVVLKSMVIPPYSRVQSPRPIIEGGYYDNQTPRPERRLF
jgi:acetyltransferase-like isoleucine patch superfamily enzyme